MKIGTYYYPEQWPRQQWARDLDNIANAGMQIVHYAEFAWRKMQPAAEVFDFEWLDTAVELAAQRGLDVILCTPTAVVPQWLLHKHPEILLTRADGSPKRVGGRRHYNPTSRAMLDASARITAAMAEHFGKRTGVVGWQIDNELSSGMFDQSASTHEGFGHWLREKYGDLDTLNAAWGNQFWQTQYDDWQQILMPVSRQPVYDNPHHSLDGSRFWSHAWRDFVKVQSDILRQHVGDAWLTTNFMPFHLDVDPADLADLIDVAGIDVYPITGTEEPYRDEDHLRYANESFLSAAFNSMAAVTGRWALLEVQPGQLNWSGVPVRPKPDAVKRMLWHAIDKGCACITVYRWRTPPWGQEMHHACLLKHDGVTPTDAGRAFFEVAAELKAQHTANSQTYQPLVRIQAKPMCGIAHEMDQVWWCKTLPQANSWGQVGVVQDWTGAAEVNGLATRQVRCDGSDWAGLAIIVLPAVQMIEEAWVDAWRTYVEAGGHLIITCRTAWQNKHGHMWERTGIAQPIHDLVGGVIVEYDGLPASMRGTVDAFGRAFDWHVWSEQIEPADGTEVLGTFANQFYAGSACITTRELGTGRVTFVGVIAKGLPEAVLMPVAMTLRKT